MLKVEIVEVEMRVVGKDADSKTGRGGYEAAR